MIKMNNNTDQRQKGKKIVCVYVMKHNLIVHRPCCVPGLLVCRERVSRRALVWGGVGKGAMGGTLASSNLKEAAIVVVAEETVVRLGFAMLGLLLLKLRFERGNDGGERSV